MTTGYHNPTEETLMAYPNPTTYTLPFMDKIRVSSRRRFILVRQFKDDDAKPFILLRSDNRAVVEKMYRSSTDYIIDQLEGTITFHFNGHKEVQSKNGMSRRV